MRRRNQEIDLERWRAERLRGFDKAGNERRNERRNDGHPSLAARLAASLPSRTARTTTTPTATSSAPSSTTRPSRPPLPNVRIVPDPLEAAHRAWTNPIPSTSRVPSTSRMITTTSTPIPSTSRFSHRSPPKQGNFFILSLV